MEEALRRARYNEIVTLEIHSQHNQDRDPTTSTITLVPCLDETTGGVQFNRLVLPEEEEHAENGRMRRELQTKSRWFFPMLNDETRSALYEQAIALACRQVIVHKLGNNDDPQVIRVLDIGSGTGLLAIWAARHLLKLKDEQIVQQAFRIEVISMEMSSPLAAIARRTVADNGLTNLITVVEGHSSSFADSKTFDLCTCELLEDGLLGEGWLMTMQDLWQRQLIDKDTILVPQSATVYGQVVIGNEDENDWLSTLTAPLGVHPTTGSLSLCLDQAQKQPLLEPVDAVLPVHAHHLLLNGRLRTVSEPVELLQCSVVRSGDGMLSSSVLTTDSRIVSVPIALPGHATTSTTAVSTRSLAVLVWWDLLLHPQVDVVYSTAPNGRQPWQDHWHPCLHFLGSPSLPQNDNTTTTFPTTSAIAKDNQDEALCARILHLRVRHNFSRIFLESVVLKDENEDDGNVAVSGSESKRLKMDAIPDEETLSIISPERALQLYDSKRTQILNDAIIAALQNILQNQDLVAGNSNNGERRAPVVLDLSDFSLCGMLAAKTGLAGRVISVEASPDLGAAAARVAQLGNGLSVENFEILQCRPEQLSLELLGGRPVDLIVAEPYYQILEGWNLQEALNFYYPVRYLRRCSGTQQLLSQSVRVLPRRCRIVGMLIESDQLRSAYRPCGDTNNHRIRGIDHTFVNQVGGAQFHTFDLSLPVAWQYEYTALTETVALGVIDYNSIDNSSNIETKGLETTTMTNPPGVSSVVTGSFVKAGRCDALLVWLEYYFDTDGDDNNVLNNKIISTRDRSQRQIVRMLALPTPTVLDLADAQFICSSQFGSCEDSMQDHWFDVQIRVGRSTIDSI